MEPEQIVSMVKDFVLAAIIFYFYTQARTDATNMRDALIASLQETLKEATATIRQQAVAIAALSGVKSGEASQTILPT